MTIYYKEKLSEEVKTILLEDDTIIPQDYVPSKEGIVSLIENLVLQGIFLIYYKYNVVIILSRKTAWVGNIDTKVGKQATAKDVIKAYKEFCLWTKEGTYYYKLETRTPLEKYGRIMAKATGASLEGIRKKSYRTKENIMVDEFEYGYIIDRGDLCQ